MVGLGPTGATAANLLGAHGLRVLAVERRLDIDGRQRAIAIDEDALRVWQGLGLLEPILADLRTRVVLHLRHRGRAFLTCELKGRGRQALPGTSFFCQPLLERSLRRGLRGRAEILSGWELVGLDQDAGGVSAELREAATGARRSIRAHALLGCDGGSSATRKLLGIALPGCSLPEPWIDIQARARGTPQPEQPVQFSFIADPARPGAECSAMGLDRWEFRLARNEDPTAASTPAGIASLLAARGVDAGAIEILHSWVYVFHSRQAERWRQGRVFLCGDAAHLMPPFAGQGVSSGVRDAANLCWKIAAVLRHGAPDAVLDSYESERRPHVLAVTSFSRRVGALVMVSNPLLAAARDAACRLALHLPWLGRALREFHIKPQWTAGPGWFARQPGPRRAAGRLLWQPWVLSAAGNRCRLDELLGAGWSYLSWGAAAVPASLTDAGIRRLVVRPRSHPAQGLAEHELVDLQGSLARLFRRTGARGLLVRPDRFIYGSDRDDLSGAVTGPGVPRPPRPPAPHPGR